MSRPPPSIRIGPTSLPSSHRSRSASLSVARSPTGQIPPFHPLSPDANGAERAFPHPPQASSSSHIRSEHNRSPSYSHRPHSNSSMNAGGLPERLEGCEARMTGTRAVDDNPSEEEELWEREYWQGFSPAVDSGDGRELRNPFTQQEGSVEDEMEGVESERGGYSGPFQPPDTRELVGMILSFAAVVTLSTAAVLTTIYDWVL